MKPTLGVRLATAVLVVAASACGAGDEPTWISLAGRFQREGGAARALELANGKTVELVHEESGTFLAASIRRDEWRFDEQLLGGTWTTGLGIRSGGTPADGSPEVTLTADDGTAFTYAPQSDDVSVAWHFPEGSFSLGEKRLLLELADGELPPERVDLRVCAGRGVNDGRARVAGTRFSGDGITLWSGEAAACTLDVPPHSVLRFATTVEPALRGQREPITFRLFVDGEPRFERVVLDVLGDPYGWHAVALPAAGGRVDLRFTVDGSFGYTAVLCPGIGPAEVGSRGQRPWAGARPDIVVFLADTFRADSMAAYGGELGITPALDAFAARSRVWRRTWSTGTFTLPAHASMFAGVFPHQVGIVGTEHGIPGAMVTLAEHLAEHGYRTGAITDSIVVSDALGMSQGFAWFDELHSTLRSTLQRARGFLDADDGRPTFLFVHTYRVHLPYRVSRETKEEWGDVLGFEGNPDALRVRVQELMRARDEPGRVESIEQALEKLHAYYLGGVVDLDRGFGSFLDDLAERGIAGRGWVVFTSDHGEAFGEHGAIYHRDKVWEVLARVPFVVSGPDVGPGVVDDMASLVDFAPTIAAMAGVRPRDEWLGRSLLGDATGRPAFVFECRRDPESTLAVVDGERKVIGFERPERLAAGELLGAYRLDEDPHELHDLSAAAAWPRELLERERPTLERLLVPLVDEEAATLSAERLEALRAMGYGGDRQD